MHWNTRPPLFRAFFAMVSANPTSLFFHLLVNSFFVIYMYQRVLFMDAGEESMVALSM